MPPNGLDLEQVWQVRFKLPESGTGLVLWALGRFLAIPSKDPGRRVHHHVGVRVGGADYPAVRDQLKGVQKLGPAAARLLQCWKMDLLSRGAAQTWVVTALQSKLSSRRCSRFRFAAILEDRSVVRWGHPAFGAESSALQPKLRNVQHLKACYDAFVAILANDEVVAWNESDSGGDASQVEERCLSL